jgi:branched-chain amino acid transport system permease protein
VFGQLIYLVVFRNDGLGSETGLYPVARSTVLGQDVSDQRTFFWVVVSALTIVAFVLRRIYQSSFGLTLAAMRDDSLRTVALGLPIRWLRLISFVLAGAIAGLAGGLFAQQQGSASPSMLSFALSGHIILICLLGGRFRFWGAAVGAIVFTWAEYHLRSLTDATDLYLGALLLVIVIAMPDGLAKLWDLTMAALRNRSRTSDRDEVNV